jgi:branched-chain amino acid transport system ATP-binding protein
VTDTGAGGSSILEVEGLTKQFGALAAVNDLSFAVREGETLGIAGPNGAGKTVLFDLVTGHLRATAGVVRFGGEEIQTMTAAAICQRGIARTFQVAAILPSQTVLGTILAGLHFGHHGRRLARLSFAPEEIDRAYELAAVLGLGERMGTLASLLSDFERKRLMIAAALATSPTILMLDEPVAGLTESEGWQLIDYVTKVKETGVTVILVEHIMSILMRVSDRVMIMHQGGKIFEGSPEDAVANRDVVRLYLGSAGVAAGDEQGARHA